MNFIKQTIKLFGLGAIMVAGLLFALTSQVNAQSYWVDDPNDCPSEDVANYPGQDCNLLDICGVVDGNIDCYDTSLLSAPAGDETTSGGGTNFSSSFDGGYILDCYDADSVANPYCDDDGTWWCDRDSSCYDVGRDTTCNGTEAASSTCSTCRTGYIECDGSYTDVDGCEIRYNYDNCDEIGLVNANNNVNSSCSCVCDTGYLDCDATGTGVGNGCEVQDGGSCSVGSLPGTWNGCSCEVDKSYFETGTEIAYSTTDPLLWGVQYGNGPLIQMTSQSASTTGGVFFVGNDGSVGIGTSSPSAMLTVGVDTGSQFLVNNTGVVTAGSWQGDAIGLEFGGTGIDLTGETGFLYVSGGALIASNTIDIASTNLVATNPLNLIGNTLSLNTGGDWTGTIDGLEGGDIFTLADWFATTSAPQLTDLENLAGVGTIGTGIWNADIIDVAYGGTGQSSWTANSIIIASSTGTDFAEINISIAEADYLLSVNAAGDGYTWVDASTAGVDTIRSREEMEDWSGALMASSTGIHTLITVAYDDTDSSMNFTVDSDLSNYDNANSAFFSTTSDTLAADFGGTGQDSSAWTGFGYVDGGVWSASNTVSAVRLDSLVMLEGEDVSLLDNTSANYINWTQLSTPGADNLNYNNTNGQFTLTSGYIIPLEASTTDWQTAYALVDANNNNWTSAYTQVTASSSEWTLAYGWDDHSTQNYFDLDDAALPVNEGGTGIASIAQGQILYGSAADTISATSSIFVSGEGFVGFGTTTPDERLVISGNILVDGDLIPFSSTSTYVGQVDNRIYRGYFENLDVSNMTIGSTSISGSASNIFTINSNNTTNDLEDGILAYERGVATPNATITWDASEDTFVFNFPIALEDANELRMYEDDANGLNFVSIVASTTLDSDIAWTLPTTQGSNGEALMLNSAGHMVWGTPTGAGTINAGTLGQVPFYSEAGNVLSATSSLFIAANSYIGIGSSSPNKLLTVAGAGNFEQLCLNGDCTSSWGTVGGIDGSGTGGQITYWVDNNTLGATNSVAVVMGGTGKSSWTPNAIPYMSSATSFGEIPMGTATYVLSVNASANGYEWVSASSTGVVLTQEEVDDYVDALINDPDSIHTRINITYDDANNAMDFVVDDDLANYNNLNSVFFSTTSDILAADFGGTGTTTANWTGFTYLDNGVWTASNTVSAIRLDSLVMLEGEDIALLDNTTANYINLGEARAGLSSNATGLTYTSGTGVFTITNNYIIPLTASTSEWDLAYSWDDHSTQNYFDLDGAALPVNEGGTGKTVYGQYSIPYMTDTTTFGEIAIGTSTYILAVNAAGTGYEWVNSSSTGVTLTQEEVEDYAGAMVAGNTETLITVIYQDSDGTVDYEVDDDLSQYDNSSSAFFSTTTDILAADFGGTGTTTANWTGFTYLNNGVWAASNTVSAVRLDSLVMLEGEDVALLDNTSANYINWTQLSASANGLDYDNLSGDFSLTTGYIIPLSASTTQWHDTYTLVDANNTNWTSAYDDVTASSSEWTTAYTNRITVYTDYLERVGTTLGVVAGYNIPLTASTTNWNTAFNDVNTNSANWDSAYSDLTASSSEWTDAYLYRLTNVANPLVLSSNQITIDGNYNIPLISSTTNWNTAYDLVDANNANWTSTYDDVTASSSEWTIAYDWINASSTYWDNKWDGLDDMTLSQGSIYVGNSSANPSATNAIFIDGSNRIGVGTTSPQSRLTAYGNLFLEGADRYINFGATSSVGVDGYGFRDVLGAIQVKNANGTWSPIGAGATALNDLNNVNTGTPDSGDLLYFTGAGWDNIATGSLGLASLSDFSAPATGLDYNNTNGQFNLTSGYIIPLEASSTDWNTSYVLVDANNASWTSAYNDVTASSSEWTVAYTNRITAYSDNLERVGTTLGVVAGYNIPLIASTTNWNTAFNDVDTNSANWDSAYADLTASSSEWTDAYIYRVNSVDSPLNLSSNSITIDGNYNIPLTASTSNWATAYDLVNASSTYWDNKWDGLDDMTLAQGSIYVGNGSANPIATSSIYIGISGNIGFGTTSPLARLTSYGNLFLEGADRYINFGATSSVGVDGYGFRDVLGAIQVKNANGSWSPIGAGATALNDLNNVNTGTPDSGDLLYYNGAGWDNIATNTLNIALSDATGNLDDIADGITYVRLTATKDGYIDQDIKTTASPSFNGLTINGNIIVSGTVDGVDISAASTTWDSQIATINTNAAMLNEAETITANWVNTANPWDVSSETNLAVGNGVTLTGDTLTVTAAGGLTQTAGGLTTTGALTDMSTVGQATGDNQFLVSTGAGLLAWESGATARTSLDVDAAGTDNSTDITFAAGRDYLSIDGSQVITMNAVNLDGSNNDLDVVGILAVDNGGTGSSTPSGILVGDGAGNFASLTDNSTNWNTAFSWGDHTEGTYFSTTTDTLMVAYGGTGMTSITDQDIVIGGAGNTMGTLSVGAEGEVLVVDGGVLAWASTSPAAAHSLLSVTHSDVKATTTLIRGDMLVVDTDGDWARMELGANGYILMSDGTDSVWASTTDITALGTILRGVWQGDPIAVEFGGTGTSTIAGARVVLDLDEVHEFGVNSSATSGMVWLSTGPGTRGEWVATSSLGLSSGGIFQSTFIGTTSVEFDGSFATSTLTGYVAANDICNYNFAGSHFCKTSDILTTIELTGVIANGGRAWIAEGPPGYTADSNDCTGWTDNSSDILGAWWNFAASGGVGWLVTCENTRPIACCSRD